MRGSQPSSPAHVGRERRHSSDGSCSSDEIEEEAGDLPFSSPNGKSEAGDKWDYYATDGFSQFSEADRDRDTPNQPTGDSREVKVVTVGESAVGKTSIALRFVTDQFKSATQTTIGASFLTKTIMSAKLHQPVKFNVWDTAGQEKYRALAALYYRGVDCALLVYDITNRNTFEELGKYWINEILRQYQTADGSVPTGEDSLVTICIIGNKCDLEDQRTVSVEEGKAFASKYRAMFFEASAKTGDNIFQAFDYLANHLPQLPEQRLKAAKDKYTIDVPPTVPLRKKGSRCC